MEKSLDGILAEELDRLKRDKVYREAPILESPQGPKVRVKGKEIIMLSSNNYLGLASDHRVQEAAIEGIRRYGYGLASVRFICGTLDIHKELEKRIADFLGYESALLYSSCSAANEGLIPAIMSEQDVIFTDELNHASIIDGIRLGKAKRLIYSHSDMEALERVLKRESKARQKMIVTDGVFSMEGDLAPLPDIVDLAAKYNALVVVDESHSTGVLGKNGRGATEHYGLDGKVDIQTGTLGKAIGGAAGGYVVGSEELIDYLTQRSRPYLFSNTLPPSIIFATLKALEIIEEEPALRDHLRKNTLHFRREISNLGFNIIPGEHPIVPIMIGDSPLALKMSERLLEKGVYVSAFGYPVVPKGKARLRVQISAAHSKEDLDRALQIFFEVGKELGILR